MSDEITTAKQAAENDLVLAFGRLLGSANRLEYLLGRAIEEGCGITHLMYEVLLILARAGEEGMPMSAISREQVLTTGGGTRLIDRMEAAGLVERFADPGDRRGRLVRATPAGEAKAIEATRLHLVNIRRYFVEAIPSDDRERFFADLRELSHSARDAIPRMR